MERDTGVARKAEAVNDSINTFGTRMPWAIVLACPKNFAGREGLGRVYGYL